MARAGDILVRTMDLLAGKVRPGVTTAELDEAAEKFIRSQGATPAFKGYRGFPGSICASPNDMVVHGIPGKFKLSRGDVLSIDIGVVYDGWVADAARTFPVGEVSPVAAKLLAGHRGVAVQGRRAVPARQAARRPRARRPGARRGRRLLDRALAGRPRDRPRHARGAADPQLRPRPARAPARGGHGARRRADDHRRPPHGPHGRRRLGDLLPGRLARRPLRVHRRDHRRRPAHPHALARVQGARRRTPEATAPSGRRRNAVQCERDSRAAALLAARRDRHRVAAPEGQDQRRRPRPAPAA